MQPGKYIAKETIMVLLMHGPTRKEYRIVRPGGAFEVPKTVAPFYYKAEPVDVPPGETPDREGRYTHA